MSGLSGETAAEMNASDPISNIFRDRDKCLVAVILLLLWQEKADRSLLVALLFILLA